MQFHYTISEKPHIQNDTITSEIQRCAVVGLGGTLQDSSVHACRVPLRTPSVAALGSTSCYKR